MVNKRWSVTESLVTDHSLPSVCLSYGGHSNKANYTSIFVRHSSNPFHLSAVCLREKWDHGLKQSARFNSLKCGWDKGTDGFHYALRRWTRTHHLQFHSDSDVNSSWELKDHRQELHHRQRLISDNNVKETRERAVCVGEIKAREIWLAPRQLRWNELLMFSDLVK